MRRVNHRGRGRKTLYFKGIGKAPIPFAALSVKVERIDYVFSVVSEQRVSMIRKPDFTRLLAVLA